MSSRNSKNSKVNMLYESKDNIPIDVNNINSFNKVFRTCRCQYDSLTTEQKRIYRNGEYLAHQAVPEGISLNKYIIRDSFINDEKYGKYISVDIKKGGGYTYIKLDFLSICKDKYGDNYKSINNMKLDKLYKHVCKHFSKLYDYIIENETKINEEEDN